MFLEFKIGNIFDSEAIALVNPVNTDGIMGKGLAYQFKKLYPKNFENYKKICELNLFKIGTDLICTSESGKYIINFPTKKSWKLPSEMSYIKIGLQKLKELIIKENIQSIAIPPLGAGNGGLNWENVRNELITFSEEMKDYDINIYIYTPSETEIKLTHSHLLILKGILLSYDNGITSEWLSDLIFQKLFYFSDKFIDRNHFKYSKHIKGPFSVTTNILYKELKKYRNTNKIKLRELESNLEKKYSSDFLKKEENSLKKSVELIKIIKGYYGTKTTEELEDKVELAATVIYIMDHNKKSDENLIFEELMKWNSRKKEKYDFEDVKNILTMLENNHLIEKNLFGSFSINMVC